MSLTREQIDEFATRLDGAATQTQTIVKLTDEAPEMDIESAYDVQRALIARHLSRGERLIGMKMGLTSRAKMAQMGVHNPIYGHLTDAMLLANGGALPHGSYGHPRAAPQPLPREGD